MAKKLAIGWDVGGWNCDKNRKSRDAVVVLDGDGNQLGAPWWGNLKTTILGESDFVEALLGLCDVRSSPNHQAVVAVDAPLGFPAAFTALLRGEATESLSVHYGKNPYLFRETERRLFDEGAKPLSALKDQIGSQATKAMHVVCRFAPVLRAPGIWTDGERLTVIETYPSLCRRRLGQARLKMDSKEADIADASLCAAIARLFMCDRGKLEPPSDDVPSSEGWIWAPAKGDSD